MDLRITAVKFEEKRVVNFSFGDGQYQDFFAVGGEAFLGSMSHSWMQVIHCMTSLYCRQVR